MQMCLDRNASLHATGLKRNFIFLSSNCVVCLVVFGAVWATMVAAMCGCCYFEVAPSDSESMVCCPWAGNETQNYQCLSLLTFSLSLSFFFLAYLVLDSTTFFRELLLASSGSECLPPWKLDTFASDLAAPRAQRLIYCSDLLPWGLGQTAAEIPQSPGLCMVSRMTSTGSRSLCPAPTPFPPWEHTASHPSGLSTCKHADGALSVSLRKTLNSTGPHTDL